MATSKDSKFKRQNADQNKSATCWTECTSKTRRCSRPTPGCSIMLKTWMRTSVGKLFLTYNIYIYLTGNSEYFKYIIYIKLILGHNMVTKYNYPLTKWDAPLSGDHLHPDVCWSRPQDLMAKHGVLHLVKPLSDRVRSRDRNLRANSTINTLHTLTLLTFPKGKSAIVPSNLLAQDDLGVHLASHDLRITIPC